MIGPRFKSRSFMPGATVLCQRAHFSPHSPQETPNRGTALPSHFYRPYFGNWKPYVSILYQSSPSSGRGTPSPLDRRRTLGAEESYERGVAGHTVRSLIPPDRRTFKLLFQRFKSLRVLAGCSFHAPSPGDRAHVLSLTSSLLPYTILVR